MSLRTRFPDLRTKLSLTLGYLPQRRSTDVFIVAHPRSGSTWLRTMLVNVIQPVANSDPDVFNRLSPGASIRNARAIWELPSPRILTSHTSYYPGLPKVVYVVRDGRDVLVSYYHYVIHRKSRLDQTNAPDLDFPAFFERYYQGDYHYIWHRHVESWLTRGKRALGDRMLILRFEEMKADPQALVDRVVQFIGIPADEERVAAAVQQADLDRMRAVEKQRWQAKGLGMPDQATSFYRSGQSGNWKAYFTPELAHRFLTNSARAMELAGYQP